ncbi:hypothetical protein [Streptomyces sp. NBC_01235]|uniref:hypothetical protein n=1 Tax=Streptomyces sp. NBC_01235 TaxID=2903788 RepID=UPI002E143A01|nr:hypothetical protein OG289_15535 [Streptomyces sp. NBC_01235]
MRVTERGLQPLLLPNAFHEELPHGFEGVPVEPGLPHQDLEPRPLRVLDGTLGVAGGVAPGRPAGSSSL